MADITLAILVVIGSAFYVRFTLALLGDLKSNWIGYFLRLEPELSEYPEVLPGDPDSIIDIAA